MKIEEGKFYRNRIGMKIGPMRKKENILSGPERWSDPDGDFYYSDGTWRYAKREISAYDLVAEWADEPEATGPVRTKTVTETEIVPGVYGRFKVTPSDGYTRDDIVVLEMANRYGDCSGAAYILDAAELRAAATLFNQLADALEGGAS